MEDELKELKEDIRKAKADLEQAKDSGDRELILERERRLNLLLAEKVQLSAVMGKKTNYNLEDTLNGKILWNLFLIAISP